MMKKILFSFVFAFFHLCLTAGDKVPITKQEIRYSTDHASEVYIVWGLNNWQSVPAELWPAGSFIRDGLLHTPMIDSGNVFVAFLNVPQKSTVDYVFLVAKGPKGKPTDFWDTNHAPYKDYHLAAFNDNVITVEPVMVPVPKVPLTILDYSGKILVFSICAFLLLVFLLRRKGQWPVYPGAVNVVVCGAFLLALFLMLVRPSVAGYSWDLYFDPMMHLDKFFLGAFYDVEFVFCLAALFVIMIIIMRRYKRSYKIITPLFLTLCVLLLIVGILNIKIVENIGRPFSYQWLYYSDFLDSADARVAMNEHLSGDYVLSIISLCFSFLLLIATLVLFTYILPADRSFLKVSYICIPALAILYLMIAGSSVEGMKIDRNKLVNPVLAFAASTSPTAQYALLSMEIPESMQFDPGPKENKGLSSFPKIKNVIVFVLESTPAEYISAYGSKYKITPELDRYVSSSFIFENVYAHAPATNNSMLSILGSVYPWMSHSTLTQEHPTVNIPTISACLKDAGYRTAFFNSADNRFQRANEFLSCRKFDEIKDCNTHNCGQEFTVNEKGWNFLNGKDDECTATEMLDWIKMKEQPFFAMMWTYQTHYPYFASGEQLPIESSDPVLNRYLNALHHSDEVFGKMMRSLEEMGLLESTLVVVAGDHGEAFGRHNQVTHALEIYEENLHIPCMLINPAFKGERKDGIAGLIDIAPTIMDILNVPAPQEWQGKNLFSRTKNDRVYFFSPWSDYLIGYRQGDHKYIFNASKDETEIYDLSKDPLEAHPLSAGSLEIMECKQRMAAWAQHVNDFMRKRLPGI
jgi:arylsulfatase A-like enzyme